VAEKAEGEERLSARRAGAPADQRAQRGHHAAGRARALAFLADVLPSSCSAIVRHGAVPAFCARLLTIEYIDLAEQSLQARPPAAAPACMHRCLPAAISCPA
jgi:hypothetical protein